jgi:hypothetical protein
MHSIVDDGYFHVPIESFTEDNLFFGNDHLHLT